MKKLTLLLFSVFALTAMAQVTTVPAIIQKGYTGEVTIIFNPNEGNKGMASATQCYAHTGVITSASTADNDWKNVVEEWRKNTTKTQMTFTLSTVFPALQTSRNLLSYSMMVLVVLRKVKQRKEAIFLLN